MRRYIAVSVAALICLTVIAACQTEEPVAEEIAISESEITDPELAEQQSVEEESVEPGATEPGAAEPEAAEEEATTPSVLVVHSYHEGFEWTDAEDAAIRKVLEGTNANIVSHYMDTKRYTDEDAKVKAGEDAHAAMAEADPDVVVVTDDNAQQYFASAYAGQTDAPQFVFAGVNGEPEEYGYPAANVTGVLERLRFAESLSLLREMIPDVERVALLGDDSPTANAMFAYAKTLELPVEIVAYEQPDTFDEWQAAVLKHQQGTDALAIVIYHTIKAAEGDTTSMSPQDVMAWTKKNNELPMIGLLDIAVQDGVLGGVVESGEEQGRLAGEIAAAILGGASAGDIPLTTSAEGLCLLNLTTARELGIQVMPDLLETCDLIE